MNFRQTLEEGKIDNLRWYMKYRIDPNITFEDGHYPLEIVTYHGYHDMLELLLISGADPNTIPYYPKHNQPIYLKSEALLWAVRIGDIKSTELLLKYGANPNGLGKTCTGQTFTDGIPLIDGCSNMHNPICIKKLLDSDANVNITDFNGLNALMIAVQLPYLQTTKILIEYGININHKDNIGNTVLNYCNNDETKNYLYDLMSYNT